MKFTINKEEFTKTLLNVSRIVPQKPINPKLSTLKLVLNSNGLNITGSNDDLVISETIPLFKNDKEIIRDIKQGKILVNAKIITEVARKIDGDELTFELVDNSIAKIANEKTKFELNTIDSNEYPDIDLEFNGTHVVLEKNQFVDAVNSVAFAASQKDTRLLLTCINLTSEENTLTITATDGARLASQILEVNEIDKFSINIPSKSLIEIIKSFTDEDQVEMFVSERKILFILNNKILTSKLVPGEYPTTKNIIPKNFFYYLEVNSNEFLNTIDRISLLSSERENVIKLTLTPEMCEVSSKSIQIGSAKETLNLFKFQGERLEISFNASFVSSAIRALKTEDVIISFIGEMKPFTITNKNKSNIIQLITPLRTY